MPWPSAWQMQGEGAAGPPRISSRASSGTAQGLRVFFNVSPFLISFFSLYSSPLTLPRGRSPPGEGEKAKECELQGIRRAAR